jgi:hypothetical protein
MFFIFLGVPAQVTSFNEERTSGTSTKSNENEDWVKSGELPAQTSSSGAYPLREEWRMANSLCQTGTGFWDPASEGGTRLVKGRTPTTC